MYTALKPRRDPSSTPQALWSCGCRKPKLGFETIRFPICLTVGHQPWDRPKERPKGQAFLPPKWSFLPRKFRGASASIWKATQNVGKELRNPANHRTWLSRQGPCSPVAKDAQRLLLGRNQLSPHYRLQPPWRLGREQLSQAVVADRRKLEICAEGSGVFSQVRSAHLWTDAAPPFRLGFCFLKLAQSWICRLTHALDSMALGKPLFLLQDWFLLYWDAKNE